MNAARSSSSRATNAAQSGLIGQTSSRRTWTSSAGTSASR
jgi:hypothetical protein